MERRDFFRLMLGAAALLPPSQVWPFRKIFIPPLWKPETFTISASNGHLFKKGDRVRIYRTAPGLEEYYLVDEIDATTGIRLATFNLGKREEWLNLNRS